jgi:hypothetical protein
MFYREEFRITRVEKLTIMYAMTKKEKISPIKLMAHYWLTIPGLKRGAVTCTSWVTRIANGLGLLDSAVIVYINISRRIIGSSFFSESYILRKRNRKIIMMYKGYTKEIELLDRTLGLYSVENFVLHLQKLGQAVGRSPSAQITRNPNLRYQGEDATPPEPAFTSYFDFDRPGPSHAHHQPWEDQIPFDTNTFAGAQWGLGDHWGPGNYANYHP